MKSRFLSSFVLGLVLATSAHAASTLIAGFNFNNAIAGASGQLGTFNTVSPEAYASETKTLSPATHGVHAATATIDLSDLNGTMGGTANNNWGTFVGTTTNAISGDGFGEALAIVGSGNNGSSITIQTDIAGYENIVLTYATRGTGSGFTTHDWEYSTDGITYLSAGPSITGRTNTTYTTQTVDLTGIAAVDSAATIWFKLTLTGASGNSGNNRIDNLQIHGVAIPEPTAALLGSLGLLFTLRRRR